MSVINWTQYFPAPKVNNFRENYIELPVFNVTGLVWKGASEVVLQYNFAASKDFVLLQRPTKPTGVNYGLCIRYRVGDEVTRYKLWEDELFVLSDDAAPLYSGQRIRANFVLEIWSFNGETEASQASVINMTVSARSLITGLTARSAEVFATGTEFSDLENEPTVYSLSNGAGVIDYWIADSGFNTSTGQWNGTLGQSNLLLDGISPASAAFEYVATNADIKDKACIKFINDGSRLADSSSTQQPMGIIVFRQDTWVANKYISDNPQLVIQQKTTEPRVNLTHSSSSKNIDIFTAGQWCILAWYKNADGNIGYKALNFVEGIPIELTPSGGFSVAADAAVAIGAQYPGVNGALFSVAALAAYTQLDTDVLLNDYNYFVNYYQTLLALPMTFNEGGPWNDNDPL